ncbi:hypothetical protein [Paracraurococcus lichenis]|uniref:Uncharacterized protein n=1 Tax=Paracraurococcus lichenis TaxID=3064888 RepID=A0ABT9E5E9_9PROT|nr:hypothetical protein [Paracraurococcus sp. LOR1-02]MDO9711388.1 hypothetical protein [Paracraurococcus sp. LOR1-02]
MIGPAQMGRRIGEERSMRAIGIALAFGAALAVTAGAAEAAGKRSGKAAAASTQASTQDNMADQLNAQSLQRAQAGQNSPTPGPDSTTNLNRMSEKDAATGRAMNSAPMPFR